MKDRAVRRALLLHETGLRYREDSRLYANKPSCHGQTSFVRIGLTECYFAIAAMCYGTLLSLAVLGTELVWHRNRESIGRAVLALRTELRPPGFLAGVDSSRTVHADR